MRIILFYSNQLILVALLIYLAYLPTLKTDVFNWGNTNNDGLYLLVVPIVLLPLVIFFSTVKYLIIRKIDAPIAYKFSFILPVVIVLLDSLILSTSSSNVGFLSVAIMIFIASLLLLLEMILFKSRLFPQAGAKSRL